MASLSFDPFFSPFNAFACPLFFSFQAKIRTQKKTSMCTGRFIPKNQPAVGAKKTMPVLSVKQF
jgi:hypothetical protein